MEDKTVNAEDAIGVQVYSTEKIDINMFPTHSPYPISADVEGGDVDLHKDAVEVLKSSGVVFYRDSLNAEGIVLSDKTGPMFYSQFYLTDEGKVGRIFRLNVDRIVVQVTPQAVTWK